MTGSAAIGGWYEEPFKEVEIWREFRRPVQLLRFVVCGPHEASYRPHEQDVRT